MPCPFFEPQKVVEQPTRTNARLPLIGEFIGLCHAGETPVVAPEDLLFAACNQGYSRGTCSHFPGQETRSALRYSVVAQTDCVIDLLCIEEADYAPLHWDRLQYRIADGQLSPETTHPLMRAQAVAFAREHLRLQSA